MPYRRLPNTDNARLRSLRLAFEKGKELPPFKLSYSQKTFYRVQAFLPTFEKVITQYKSGFLTQVEKSKEYIKETKKAKLYISHFIQVLNMAILRGDLNASTRSYFDLDKYENKLPALNTENEIIHWGEKLIQGETERIRHGQNPITNPTIAMVKVRFEIFIDAYRFQKTLQKSNNRNLTQLAELRSEADDIIQHVWNEVEETFSKLSDQERRHKAEEYGLVYVFRKNELKTLNIKKDIDVDVEV